MDLVDISHAWMKERYPTLYYEVIVNDGCTDGKVVIVHHKKERSADYENWRENHIFTLSVKGACWHSSLRTTSPHFSLRLNAADPTFFETLDHLIKRAVNENRQNALWSKEGQ